MVTLTVILAILIILALIILFVGGVIGVSLLAIFGDLIIAILIVTLSIKLVRRIKRRFR